MPAIKSVDQLQERLTAVSRFLDAMGAAVPAKEVREVCGFLEAHRGKTLEQLVNPPPKDGPVAEVEKLYARAGSPGLGSDEIERVFASKEVKKLGMGDLKALATKLDIAPGKLKKDELLSRMKVNVLNRAGMHGRVQA
jgi:hypothetical protein